MNALDGQRQAALVASSSEVEAKPIGSCGGEPASLLRALPTFLC
jgi:hypothetical protein